MSTLQDPASGDTGMDECFLLDLCEDRVANSPKTWRGLARTLDLSAIAQRVREECAACTGSDKQRIVERRRQGARRPGSSTSSTSSTS